MQRRSIRAALGAILLLVPSLSACALKSDPEAAAAIRIYQVLPIPRKTEAAQAEGAGQAIALVNADTKPHTITAWVVQIGDGRVILPKLTLEAGQVIYLANQVPYFERYWNFSPDFEYGQDTDKAVPDLKMSGQEVPLMRDEGDIIRLLDEHAQVVDILAYGKIDPPAPWSGQPVQLVDSHPITPDNQVITRLKQGETFRLEPKATSWSGGTPEEPERVYFPGQSDMPIKTVHGPMTLAAFAAPDNAGRLLFDMVEKARKSIRLVGYQFGNSGLADQLVAAAKRGIRVQVAIDRRAGNDLVNMGREMQEKLAKGGVEVFYLHDFDGLLSTRYSALHSRYAIFDDEAVLISSGDWTRDSYSLDTTCGNRDWSLAISGNADVVKLFKEVWEADFAAGNKDIRVFDEKLDRPVYPDTTRPGYCSRYTPVKPSPLFISGEATVTRILGPDNTLDREKGLLGLLRSAKQEILISASDISLWWGDLSQPANLKDRPNPYLTEIVAAARRGVKVKVLLDQRNAISGQPAENPYVVQYLNDLAKREQLPLAAKLVNMNAAGLGRAYQANGMIVDGATVIGGIDGLESSFRSAREMALKVEGVAWLTDYYRELFQHDWEVSAY